MITTIEEILALPDIGERIEYLKKGRGYRSMPNTSENFSDWVTELHEIKTNRVKYPDRRVMVEKEKTRFDNISKKTITLEAVYETEEINRLTIPIEQDQVNIHTAFTVGTEPNIKCDTQNDEEKKLLSAVNFTLKNNKTKYLNKKEVRSWLSEQEVAEYWYTVEDKDGFWNKLWGKIKVIAGINPTKKLKCAIWSPFRGDSLYPFFENEDMTGFMRVYNRRNLDNTRTECYCVLTDKEVINWEQSETGWKETRFNHGFNKMPLIYMWRRETLCHKIKDLRVRLEKVLSNYADCIDYNFFPYLMLYGNVDNLSGKAKSHTIEMSGEGANASYLTWDQAPETVKFEVNTLIEQIYSLTNTPRVSFEVLSNMGSAPSGTAFRFYFMGAHMAVENHAEDVGEFLQRRLNFLVSALGSMSSKLEKASKTIDIETEIVPYMIDSVSDKVATAVNAQGKIWDTKTCIQFVGNVDKVDEVVKQLEEENSKTDVSKNKVKPKN